MWLALIAVSAAKPRLFKKMDIVELQASMDGGALCPGSVGEVHVVAIDADGDVHERVLWRNLEAASGGVAFDAGRVSLAEDPAASWGAAGSVRIESKHHPGVSTELRVPVRYDCAFTANFSGPAGRDGADGAFGSSGDGGKNEQSSESYAAPGGHGQTGGDGGDGGDGEAGRDADDLVVEVDTIEAPDGTELLIVRIDGQHWIVDPRAGSLTVWASGGRGGRGGHGGPGGSGGGGGTGAPPGDGGDGGRGGNGGDGADGGDGAEVTLVVDPAAKQHLGAIVIENGGGVGGPPGNAGFGGSGGNTFSGAEGGESGDAGVAGQRGGRDGRAGPPPVVTTKALSLTL